MLTVLTSPIAVVLSMDIHTQKWRYGATMAIFAMVDARIASG